MILKELFDKEFLYESKKEENKMNKIFYKFDIKIVKKAEEEMPANAPADNNIAPAPEGQPQDQGTIDLSMPDQSAEMPAEPAPENGAEPAPQEPLGDFQGLPTASVVTEDDNDKAVEINDDNNIVRKLEGEVLIPKEDVDNIQTVEDLLSKLTEEKIDGVNILDEFTADVIQVLANPATQTQIATMIDKKSMIFAEIIYGKKREESVGLRIIKRKNSDMVTTTMLIDNKIINAPYKKETLDERIVDIRNNEYDTEEK